MLWPPCFHQAGLDICMSRQSTLHHSMSVAPLKPSAYLRQLILGVERGDLGQALAAALALLVGQALALGQPADDCLGEIVAVGPGPEAGLLLQEQEIPHASCWAACCQDALDQWRHSRPHARMTASHLSVKCAKFHPANRRTVISSPVSPWRSAARRQAWPPCRTSSCKGSGGSPPAERHIRGT